MADDDTQRAMAQLQAELARTNSALLKPRWRILGFQFLRGLAFGLGSVFGATILVSLLAWWVSQFEFLPLIGDWLARLVDQIETAR